MNVNMLILNAFKNVDYKNGYGLSNFQLGYILGNLDTSAGDNIYERSLSLGDKLPSFGNDLFYWKNESIFLTEKGENVMTRRMMKESDTRQNIIDFNREVRLLESSDDDDNNKGEYYE